jgi:hypothetical protein
MIPSRILEECGRDSTIVSNSTYYKEVERMLRKTENELRFEHFEQKNITII